MSAVENLFTASWTDGNGYVSGPVALPWEEAHAWLLTEVCRNVLYWQRRNPDAPQGAFAKAVEAIENAPPGKGWEYTAYGYAFGFSRA